MSAGRVVRSVALEPHSSFATFSCHITDIGVVVLSCFLFVCARCANRFHDSAATIEVAKDKAKGCSIPLPFFWVCFSRNKGVIYGDRLSAEVIQFVFDLYSRLAFCVI